MRTGGSPISGNHHLICKLFLVLCLGLVDQKWYGLSMSILCKQTWPSNQWSQIWRCWRILKKQHHIRSGVWMVTWIFLVNPPYSCWLELETHTHVYPRVNWHRCGKPAVCNKKSWSRNARNSWFFVGCSWMFMEIYTSIWVNYNDLNTAST